MQGTTFTNSQLVLLDDEPMHLVTLGRVKEWVDKGYVQEVAYDPVGEGDDGMLQYRCRYRQQDDTNWYLLADPEGADNGSIEIPLLTGWRAVLQHHKQYGDGRMAMPASDGRVLLF